MPHPDETCEPVLTESLNKPSYRYDLDGLRGLAIALVVFFHVFIGRVSGGVDVFLLLSGYFFLGSQLRYAARDDASLNPWWPMWRTIRRLVPALALVIGVTVVLVLIATPWLMNIEFAQQISASLLYYQNWELTRQEAAYAAAAPEISPLQHLWSMSVQGQFYLAAIAFALLLAALLRSRREHITRVAGPILIVVTIVSFAYASRFGVYGTPDNYYSTFSRLWELSLGAVLVIYGSRITMPRWLADVAGVIGLVLLFATGIIVEDSTAYPGPLSLIPLGGAVLLVLGGNGVVARGLATRPMRWFGDIAYSLYLWHWALLILATNFWSQSSPNVVLGISIIVVSLVLAWLTYRCVEKPLRQKTRRRTTESPKLSWSTLGAGAKSHPGRVTGAVVTTIALLALLTVQPWWTQRLHNERNQPLPVETYPGVLANFGHDVPDDVAVAPDPQLVSSLQPVVSEVHCFIPSDFPSSVLQFEESRFGEPCVFGDRNADKAVYLVGGSHSEQWAGPLDALGKKYGFRLEVMLRAGCPIVTGPNDMVVGSHQIDQRCYNWGQRVIEKLLDEQPELVISNSTRPSGDFGHGPDYVPYGYAAFWQELADADIDFVGLRDNPWGFRPDGEPFDFSNCLVNGGLCSVARNQVYQEVDPAEAVLDELGMEAVDTADWFCDRRRCDVVIGNIAVYRDMHHISNAYAKSAQPLLEPIIKRYVN